MTRRVVVTGIGMVTPVGQGVDETWQAIKAGKSGIAHITRFDTTDYAVKIAAEVKNWVAEKYIPHKEIRRRSLYQQFLIAAAKEAIENSGFEVPEDRRHRAGTIIGSAIGGIERLYDESLMLFETKDPRRVNPFGIPMVMANGGSNLVSIMIGATGPSYTPVSACATGADSIGMAFEFIRIGKLDQVLAGAAEAPIIPIGIASFDRAGACSHENARPELGCRPFDKSRTGLVFGEGAGVLALEELEFAKRRGANILGEVVGYSSSSDAYHMTAPDPDGRGAAAAMSEALEDAQLNPEDIQYINAHGTGTQLNDTIETKAVKRVFGEHAYNVPMSSTKSMVAHCMGATAAMEAIFALLAIRDQVVPPTINLEEPDPECDLDYVPNVARDHRITYAMSNAFGFGGHNTSLIFKAFEN